MKKQYTKLRLLAAGLLLTGHVASGQTSNAVGAGNGNLTVTSPNAANLGTYGKIPVSLFSGIANVGVPITTMQYRDISVPVSLSYQYRGFRPNEHPGWVGLGWSLNAGGVVTRVRKGEADEMKIDGSANEYGYLYAANRNKLGDLAANFSNMMLGQGQKDLHGTTVGGIYFFDTEPDEFVFNVNGLSGRFYFDNSAGGKWVMQSDQDLSMDVNVEVESTTPLDIGGSGSYKLQRYIKKITLTGKDGTQYVFGGNVTSTGQNIELSRSAPSSKYGNANAFEKGNNIYVSSWYLAKIISPLGNEVQFYYAPDWYSAEVIPNFEIEQYANNGPGTGSGTKRTNYNTASVSVTSTCYLDSISAPDGQKIGFSRSYTTYDDPPGPNNNWQGLHVEEEINPDYVKLLDQGTLQSFNYPDVGMTIDGNIQTTFYNKWSKLNTIRISYKGVQSKEFDLDYYKQSDNNSQTKRLELKSVKLMDAGGTVSPYYSFDYWSYAGLQPPTVPYGTRKIDHWGFSQDWSQNDYFKANLSYASDTATINLDGNTITGIGNAYSTSRGPDVFSSSPHSILGALKTIYYPTGGSSVFEYESNAYRKVPVTSYSNGTNVISLNTETANVPAGGIRIRRITSYGATDPGNPTLNLGGAPVVKEYFYVNDYATNGTGGTSSGVLTGGYPKYTQSGTGNLFPYNTDPPLFPNPGAQTLFNDYCYWSNNPILPLEGNGNHVNYSEVTEKNGDGSYTVYEYSNFDKGGANLPYNDKITDYEDNKGTYTITNVGNGLAYHSLFSMNLERGKLLTQKFYSNTNALQKMLTYNYNTDPGRFSNVVNAIVRRGHTLPFTFNGGRYYTIRSYATGYYLYHHYLKSVTETDYFDNSTTHSSETDYAYDADRNLASEILVLGNNQYKTTQYLYAGSPTLTPPTGTGSVSVEGIRYLRNNKIKGALIEQYTTIGGLTNYTVTGGKLYTYKTDKPVVSNTYSLETATPLTNFLPARIDNGNFIYNSQYNLLGQVNNYSPASGFVYEVEERKNKTACLRDYGLQYITAKAANTANGDIAYTSFEGDYSNDPLYENYGNWLFARNNITTGGLTGKKCLNLQNGGFSSRYSVGTSKRYVLSFWKNGTGIPNVQVSTISVPLTQVKTVTVNGSTWTLCTGSFIAPNTATVTLGGASCYVDEVKLYPEGSDLQTYTYDYVNGMTTDNNSNNNIRFYEYDPLSRLVLIRDIDNNVVKKLEYNVQKPE